MHDSVMEWVAGRVDTYQLANRRTLEVGSRDVNGSVRGLFTGEYVGMDMIDGPGVDVVARSDMIPFPNRSFAVVVCTEMLEHDPFPWLTVPEIARVLAPQSDLLLTTRGIGFPHHSYPDDYWRFTKEAIQHLFSISGLHTVKIIDDPSPDHPGVLGHARRLG